MRGKNWKYNIIISYTIYGVANITWTQIMTNKKYKPKNNYGKKIKR